MDLIYADSNNIKQGVIKNYSFDLACGANENDFQLTIKDDDYCLKKGYSIFIETHTNGIIEGTEYGGTVDDIEVDTGSNVIIYHGRTWQGILEDKIIKPLNGYDYYTVEGEAHEVLRGIINHLGINDIFEVDNAVSEIFIPSYQFRYDEGYTSINKMLFENGGKLIFKHKKDKIILSVTPYIDYSADEEWMSNLKDFIIKKNLRTVNHLICLGKGNLKDRIVIHLFADENGGLLPYAKTDNPMQDSDYILDTSQQVLFGIDEIEKKYEYQSADLTYNYIPLIIQPDDWSKNFENYYIMQDDKYSQVVAKTRDSYALLSIQPDDWLSSYSNYFEKKEDGYRAVEGFTKEQYKKLSKRPNDWTRNYKNYYYFYSDGVSSEYKAVEGINKYSYRMQTMKPTDWKNNYGQYYRRKKKGGYEAVTGVKKGKKEYAPIWRAKKYYTRENYRVAPKFESIYYSKTSSEITAPTFKSKTYYSKVEIKVTTPFETGVYYKKVTDSYAVLVKNGIQKLNELKNKDSIKLDENVLNGNYDINDVVGVKDNITNFSLRQQIVKKIVEINAGKINLKYEIGEIL